jgi:hypothetical protein
LIAPFTDPPPKPCSNLDISITKGCWARWRRAEQTRQVAKAAAESAGRAVWRARGVIVVTGLVVYAVISFWFRGRVR